ncbi:helix-turn-helix transcriptional regulator [Streptomyces sp. NBC_01304]|uniref:helix-turn-helix transcriptional regulator n=1 Tax=Streptomyces sp. NBC_01304 TaxID=2903818 RepID=UPI002E13C375|nr:LuxR C-terminal-related transcriptional regulator [Streptomyces sp. NBC_01304]
MKHADVPLWLDEPNVIFRRGLADCLTRAGFVIVGESARLLPAPDLGAAALLVTGADPECLPGLAALLEGRPLPLLGLLDAARPEWVRPALECGFAGLLVRAETTPEGLVAAVDAIAAGTGALPPALLAGLLADLGGAGRLRAVTGLLARRELDVLRLLADGSSTREIAGALAYSERTVKNIVHDTLTKLNCRTRAHAVATVVRQGAL